MRYRYLEVPKTPQVLEEDVVYVNRDFEIATLLCACGCRHKITLLIPDGHTVLDDGGFATIRPSVGVWDSVCKSHYFVNRGKVDWCESWSDAKIKRAMMLQRDRHAAASTDSPWYRRLWRKFEEFVRRTRG